MAGMEHTVHGQVEIQAPPVQREGQRVLWAAPCHHCAGNQFLGLADTGSCGCG